MRSLAFFDERYPVRTVFTDNGDLSVFAGLLTEDAVKSPLQDYLRTPLRSVMIADERHSANVLAVSGQAGKRRRMTEYNGGANSDGGYDALVTDEPGILLCVRTADCLPLFLYDTEKHVAAIAHCGRIGVCGGIVSRTVGVMTARFGAAPAHLVAAFGPGICAGCYEVGGEVIAAFSERFPRRELEELFRAKQNGKYLLDLGRAAAFELMRAGVPAENIRGVEVCSYESENYPSYRRGGKTDFDRQTLSGIVLL